MQARSAALMVVFWSVCTGFQITVWPLSAEEPGHQVSAHGGDTIPAAPVTMKEPPIEIAEGANKCEIVSCGMGIKETCEITCPADKTPQLRLHPKHRTSMYGVQG